MLGRSLRIGLFSCLVASAVLGQTTGKIEGRITDSTSAALPGVTVEAFGVGDLAVRSAVTGRDGGYHLLALPPGSYRIRGSAPSFHSAEKAAIVSLDATATVDLALQLSASETVVVSSETPQVDTTSTTTGTNYTAKVIERLPVARNYADIVRSNPGVDTDHAITQGRSLSLTVYGATAAENLWIIDGINTTNVQMGVQGKAINAEFVQEVEVKTGSYQAEYGRSLGGLINVITKSGGNQFHGSGFFYYDSTSTTADQVFTSEDSAIYDMRIADYRRTDFGADLGGFLVKDRLWFFAAYDRVQASAQVARWQPTTHVSTDDHFPLDGQDSLYSGKLTWNFNPSSSLVGTVFGDPTRIEGASGADPRQGVGAFIPAIVSTDPSTWYSERRIGAADYGVRGNHIFGASGVATLQASRHQDRYELTAPDGVRTRDRTCPGGTRQQPCAPPPVDNFVTGGFGFIFGPQQNNASRRDQYRGDLSLYAGSHELKFGGDYQYSRTDDTTRVTGGQLVRIFNQRGVTYYQHDFFARSLEDLTPIDAVDNIARHGEFSAFLQDSWKIGPGLTVNAGLRWDQQTVYASSDSVYFRLNSEWQPRIGVVWDPRADGTTKLYAFAGRFYYSLPTNLTLLLNSRSYGTTTYNFDPVSLVQDPNVPGHREMVGPFPATSDTVDPGLKGIYQDEYTVGIERLLAPGFSVGLKGTYRRLGNAVEDRCDLDYTAAVNNYNYCGLMNAGGSGDIARGARPGCVDSLNGIGCGDSVAPIGPARRLYRGIELVTRKSVGDRLWLQASYVYSSLRGNYDGAVSEATGQTNPGLNGDFDYAAFQHNNYGSLFLDRPHRLRFDGFWTTPLNLSVGLQAYYYSGAPLDRIGWFNDFYGPAIQLDPRGSAGRMPAQWEANLSLAYPIALGPATVTAQLFVYNVFNHQTPTYRDTNWSTDYPAGWDDDYRVIFDPNQQKTNESYGKTTERLPPRSLRAAIKVSF